MVHNAMACGKYEIWGCLKTHLEGCLFYKGGVIFDAGYRGGKLFGGGVILLCIILLGY